MSTIQTMVVGDKQLISSILFAMATQSEIVTRKIAFKYQANSVVKSIAENPPANGPTSSTFDLHP